MNKIELNRLSQVNNNEQNFLTALNENMKRIQQAINDTLSRTGVAPNQMEQVLDMNGKRIVNVGPAVEPTDVVTKQDIQEIIDAAEAAIARLDGLVEAAKVAVQTYVNENVIPVLNEAVGAAEAAQAAAEAARDALIEDPGYQKLIANLDELVALADKADELQTILDNMDELLAVADDIVNIDAVAAKLTDLQVIVDNMTEILNASTYASQAASSASSAASSASSASTAASNASASATEAAGYASTASTAATTATTKASEAATSATSAAASATQADAAVTAASASATQAASSATNALIWAEGDDEAVEALGGEHSSKRWAEIAGQAAGGIIETTGDSGTLTAEQMAMIGPGTKIRNDGEIFTLSNNESSLVYATFINGDVGSDDKMAFKAIYVNTSTGAVNYGTWTKEDVASGGAEVQDASETVKGIAMLATLAEATAGTDDNKIMTPLKATTAIQGSFLKGTTAPTTATVGFVGQHYLDTVTGKSYVCTAKTAHQTPTATHYETYGGTFNYDSTTGIITKTSNNQKAYIKITNFPDIANKRIALVAKIYVHSTSIYNAQTAFHHVPYESPYDEARLNGSDAYRDLWYWYKVEGIADGTTTGCTFTLLKDQGYTRDTLPTTGWFTPLYSVVKFTSGTPGIGGGYSNASLISMTGSQVDLVNSYFIVDGVTYNFVDVETTYTYTWKEVGKEYTPGTGIAITDGTISNTGLVNNATGENALAIGEGSEATVPYAIQIGPGVNNGANCLNVALGPNTADNFNLLTNQGKIPAGRYTVMQGATSSSPGSIGVVPPPEIADKDKFLKGDGTWGEAGSAPVYNSSTKTLEF